MVFPKLQTIAVLVDTVSFKFPYLKGAGLNRVAFINGKSLNSNFL